VARELQARVLALVEIVSGQVLTREVCPSWLSRPGRAECGSRWTVVEDIYAGLTGRDLPEVMPPRERRSIDAVFIDADGRHRIVEVDEAQHFSSERALTLRRYPIGTPTAFDVSVWLARSESGLPRRGGGFAKPKPPLFPEAGGRHAQRAFRDALADLLPLEHGWAPTLRIGDFEVASWLHSGDAVRRMEQLLRGKGLVLRRT
jgi:hypothetical protein